MVGSDNVPKGVVSYDDLIMKYSASWPDVNFLLAHNPYTAGTTGIPKSSNFFDSIGFMFSDLAEPPRIDLKSFLSYNIRAISFMYWFGGTEIFDPVDKNIRTLIVTPMYHAGTIAGWAPFILMGATAVIMHKFDPERFLRLIQEERITWTFVAPTILQRVLALTDEVKTRYDLSSMRSLICAAAPCPPQVKSDINQLFMRQGAKAPVFNEYYGSAETAVVTVLLPGDYRENPKRIESVGKPRCGDMRILLEGGVWAKPGEVGKVMSRTAPTLSLRYPGSEHKLHESITMVDGEEWFDDGLLGYADEDGFLFLTGREKETIITGGVNLFPAEIEMVLFRHSAVFDAAVIRHPHPDLGEVPIACIQLRESEEATEEDILLFCREKGLHGYKVPAKVEFFGELPRHIDGKIVKRDLEKLYWQDPATGG
jgi:long-chain acyl-CoA synthetase